MRTITRAQLIRLNAQALPHLGRLDPEWVRANVAAKARCAIAARTAGGDEEHSVLLVEADCLGRTGRKWLTVPNRALVTIFRREAEAEELDPEEDDGLTIEDDGQVAISF